MDFDKITYRLAVARLMTQIEEEKIAREEAISGTTNTRGPDVPTAYQIDQRILELTEDLR